MDQRPENHSSLLKVLLFEDNPVDARLIQKMLAKAKDPYFDVEHSELLSTGIDRLASGGIDVILLDLNLPDSEGFKTFTSVNARAPQVPIVILTGLDDEMVAGKAVRKGAQDYLVKGQVNIQLLMRAMRYAIERKRAQEQARLHQQQLVQASKMAALGTLLSGIAHEINNPTNFLTLNTPILLEVWESVQPILDKHYQENGDFIMAGMNYSEMREHIPQLFSGMLAGAKRIKNIVSDLKDYSRPDPSHLTQSIDINAVVKSAINLVSNEIKKSTKHFTEHYTSDVPKPTGNSQRLEQVMINLLQNACHALPDIDRAISVSTSYDENKKIVTVEVRDEGKGIPPEELPQITDPFFTTKRDSGGTGLGLSVSSSIIKEHGGVIQFSSYPGKGTTATVTIPLTRDNEVQ